MKKIFILIIAAALIACGLSACKSGKTANSHKKELRIVTTIFPEYDWVKNILGQNPAGIKADMLLDSGVDLHSYQPTADDILKISGCDVFIYVGGESDEWVRDALKQASNKDMAVINLLETLGDSVKEEETVEGMEAEEEEGGEEAGEKEYDEHVWLSLRNASVLISRISEAIAAADPQNAGLYKANTEAYLQKLSALDGKYTETVKGASSKTLIFGDRFPFRYLTDDYGLSYYAAFAGCSAESEASFETISFLAKKADELSAKCILTIGPDHRIAETVVKNTGAKDLKILTLDSMQGTTAEDVKNGASYLSAMEKNLEVLREALQ